MMNSVRGVERAAPSLRRLERRAESDTQPNSAHLTGGLSDGESFVTNLTLRQRVKHVTWAWFTMSMATGGIANVLHAVPYRFPGLETIGTIFFLINTALFLGIWATILARFWLYPYTFRASLTHPTESLFAPAFAVSFGTLLINIVQYGSAHVGHWLIETSLVLFWVYAAVAIISSVVIYLILWSTQSFTIANMTPIWILPAYPMLIIGTHAANLSSEFLRPRQAIQVIVTGFTIQGIGFLVSLTMYSAFIYRLMTQKLPVEPLRPGMFVSVGPAAFTCAGTIGMVENLKDTLESLPGHEYMDVPSHLAAAVLRLTANWVCLWLWGLSLWFFLISLLSNLACLRRKHHMPFAMTWFSFIFPQTALIAATFEIGRVFDMYPVRIIGCAMTCCAIVVWSIVVAMMIRAVRKKHILWPEKGEDKTEGGFLLPQRGVAAPSHGTDGSCRSTSQSALQ